MKIHELFVSDVTRDIPPVVYFHEQSPQKLLDEVAEYIITGGWPPEHPNHRRVPDGIHEQYVRLLNNIAAELDKAGGPELPAVWISGFYGSGKSSFAKLLGLALDGVALPDGTSLAEAWLRRDTSPKAAELREAWRRLRQKIDPLAVVFDIGSSARDNEHIHAAAVRQVQQRLGYCSTEPLVADFELGLERDGEWARFERTAEEVLGKPWKEVKDKSLAEEEFSLIMSVMYPNRYSDPMSWFTSRGGTHNRVESPEEAVAAIGDMMKFRRPGATLFLIVDEVSQYVLANKDRTDRLRAFATAMGARLKGKLWLLALGQQKLDEDADDSFLIWARDRFPPKLRVHLAATNIRDVVHKRLLQKTAAAETQLRRLFEQARPDLKLYAYGCDAITAEEFVEVYPMLPGQIDLILQITSALRTRSTRAQGDDQAIRGLLQLLGELFREQDLANMAVGALITLDQIYAVQHTALDSDVQNSMARILSQCTADAEKLMVRAAKAVALLELIQETAPTDARLVAQCLYDRVDRGNQVAEVTVALEELRRRNLLGYSEKQGYKIQSSTGEEWERERRDIGVARETINEIVQDELKYLLALPERPRLQNRPFPWAGVFSDGRRADDVILVDPRDDATVRVDFRFLVRDERTESTWVQRSGEVALADRLVWVVGESDTVDNLARELHRSRIMAERYKKRRESLNAARKLLLQQEEIRAEDLAQPLRDAIAKAWLDGKMYFRGRSIAPTEQGAAFAPALHAAGMRILPDLFPHFIATQVLPGELLQLVEPELSGPSTKFLPNELGILELDAGRYVPACSGVVPQRVQEWIENEKGLSGTTLLAHFGAPPYGYTPNVVKACVAGLLRAGRVRIQPEGTNEITAIRDPGVRDLFERDRDFRRATIFPAGDDDIGFQARARICKFFSDYLQHTMDREDNAIADAVALYFPPLAKQLRSVETALNGLPGAPETPDVLVKLGNALEQCIAKSRQTKPTVSLVKKHLDALRDGVQLLKIYEAELTPAAVQAVTEAHNVLVYQAAQLKTLNETPIPEESVTTITEHLKSARPWREIGALTPVVRETKVAYVTARERLLEWQGQQVEQVRNRVKGREGFSTLTGEQANRVLRPLNNVATDTTAEAVAPALTDLKDPFLLKLQRAEAQANEILDGILSDGPNPTITVINLGLHNRELSTAADVEALVNEIKVRLLEQIRTGARVRLQ
jgi:hypothetical protein